ncbi:MAG: chemotaxis protein CheC [Oscillospiraceae bacterium]|jgi:chemotaxis protein CheC|nr:chemotaxis protein CheC [Oscillospiraceae bacterium]
MSSPEFEKLLLDNLDILKEIGNIGMGHTSTALSQMLSMKVTMTIPEVYILGETEAAKFAEDVSRESFGVTLGLQGDATGKIILLLSKKFAVKVLNFFFGFGLETVDELDEMSLSVIQEMGNITSGAYCNSIASMTGLFIDISTPTHCPDIPAAVVNSVKDNGKLMLIRNSFFIDNEEINSNFLFLPDRETIAMILQKLKEYYGFSS